MVAAQAEETYARKAFKDILSGTAGGVAQVRRLRYLRESFIIYLELSRVYRFSLDTRWIP